MNFRIIQNSNNFRLVYLFIKFLIYKDQPDKYLSKFATQPSYKLVKNKTYWSCLLFYE